GLEAAAGQGRPAEAGSVVANADALTSVRRVLGIPRPNPTKSSTVTTAPLLSQQTTTPAPPLELPTTTPPPLPHLQPTTSRAAPFVSQSSVTKV
ncbi:unnamed protein product, partial [Amoebophrya sp. A25]